MSDTKEIQKRIDELANQCARNIDLSISKMFTLGSTKIDIEFMYLNRDKYRGKGRPRKSDYDKCPQLYINK